MLVLAKHPWTDKGKTLLPHVHRARASARLGRWNQRLQYLPLSVGNVGRIRLPFHTYSLSGSVALFTHPLRSKSEGVPYEYRFNGQRALDSAGVYYYGKSAYGRFYDPSLARWLQADS